LERSYLSFVNLINAEYEKNAFKKSKTVIAVSDYVKKEIMNYYDLQSNKIITIHNGIDLKEFNDVKRIGLKDKLGVSNIILFMGGYSKRKGIHILLKALAKIKEKDWILIIVGGGDLKSKKEMIDLINSLNIKNKIINFSNISRELLKSILFEADLFVHPALYEPFGIAVLEAMATGKAIIATRRGGIPEILANAGVIIGVSSEELRKALEILISDLELRKKYSMLSKERVKIFDWKQIAEKYASYKIS
jgi:glycosyltransferase involved in cell wall biosynthesis